MVQAEVVSVNIELPIETPPIIKQEMNLLSPPPVKHSIISSRQVKPQQKQKLVER
jgi:hypothetical protein